MERRNFLKLMGLGVAAAPLLNHQEVEADEEPVVEEPFVYPPGQNDPWIKYPRLQFLSNVSAPVQNGLCNVGMVFCRQNIDIIHTMPIAERVKAMRVVDGETRFYFKGRVRDKIMKERRDMNQTWGLELLLDSTYGRCTLWLSSQAKMQRYMRVYGFKKIAITAKPFTFHNRIFYMPEFSKC